MKTPTNTTDKYAKDPFSFLARAMAFGSSESIYANEAQGQRELVNSDVLPSEMREGTKETLESLGLKFGETVPGDPMFIQVEMPSGWKKVATGHSMHSDLVDSQGRKRAGIFYKAASYDRKAHMSLTGRYSFASDGNAPNDAPCVVRILDGNTVIHEMPPVTIKDPERYWKSQDIATDAAEAWLNEHYPDWRNPAAYWEA